MTPLPRLMVAPNGARRGKTDHPALPITDAEMIVTARACQAAGADGIHLHIRDAEGLHLIDAERYRELLQRLEEEVPGMYLQVTSESADRFSAQEQRDMMRRLKPKHVSVALREMLREPEDEALARDFYHWAAEIGMEIQHILYTPDEVKRFLSKLDSGLIPGKHHLIQLVQGTYANGATDAVELDAYLKPMEEAEGFTFDWMLCAFGDCETKSLVEASHRGGKARVGFENSLWNSDGSLAVDNAARVREVDSALRA